MVKTLQSLDTTAYELTHRFKPSRRTAAAWAFDVADAQGKEVRIAVGRPMVLRDAFLTAVIRAIVDHGVEAERISLVP